MDCWNRSLCGVVRFREHDNEVSETATALANLEYLYRESPLEIGVTPLESGVKIIELIEKAVDIEDKTKMERSK